MAVVTTIQFRIQTEELGRGELLTVTPYIDEVSLVELTRRVEASAAAVHGEAKLAGNYAGLVVDGHSHDWTGWYRNDHPQTWFNDGDSCLLGCRCGDTGCWPLTTRISLDERQVTWSHFRTGHRSWNLSALGPFTFNRRDYDHALQHPTMT